MTTSQTPLKSLAPITLASITSAVAMYPVDVWRAMNMASATGAKQTLSGFVQAHGISGLLRQGVGPEIARATLMRVFKFFNYPIVHRCCYGRSPAQGTVSSRAIAGSIATIPEVVFITPMELAKIGLQLDREKRFQNSGLQLVRFVHQQRGFFGIFPGFLGVQGRQALWTGTFFATLPLFEGYSIPIAQRLFSASSPVPLDPSAQRSLGQFLGGFLAGVAGAAVNTPVDVVRTNCQKAALQQVMEEAEKGAVQRARPTPAFFMSAFTEFAAMSGKIVAEKGLAAMYLGFIPKAVHLGGGGALMAWLVPWFSKKIYGQE